MRGKSGSVDRPTVFVVGSLNADISYRVADLPLPGETILAHAALSSPGGKGANQAIAAAAAGASTRMVGVVGDDLEASGLVDALSLRGVDIDGIVHRSGVPTGRAVVVVDDSGENSIVVLPGANAELDADAVAGGLSGISRGDVLVLQNEVPAAANRTAARIARDAGAAVVWNAAPAPVDVSDLVDELDLLVVNESELLRLAALLEVAPVPSGTTDPPQSRSSVTDLLADVLGALSRRAPFPARTRAHGVCTLGADGAVVVSPEGSHHVGSPRVVAVDTTAAGDTVVGYLAALARLPLLERARTAGAAGALAVTRPGASASIPTLGEVGRKPLELAVPAAPSPTPSERTTV